MSTHKERMQARRVRQLALTAGFTPSPRTSIRHIPALPTPQVTRDNSDGGYSVYHPTRGWRRVSPKRLRAQGLMAGAVA